jgi:hypothetical protein
MEIAAGAHMCQEIAFMGARCRIEVRERRDSVATSRYVATMSVLEDEDRVLRPIVFRSGEHAAVSGATEALALASAVSYLEGRFGSETEYLHACVDDSRRRVTGEPFVIDA